MLTLRNVCKLEIGKVLKKTFQNVSDVFLSCNELLGISRYRSYFALSPPNKLLSAKFLVCFNFQSALTSLKIGENAV